MKDSLLNALGHIKIAATQASGDIKETIANAAADMKVGVTVAAGTTAGGVWSGQWIVTGTGLVLSLCLIVKYVVDIKKSLVEVEIMKQKERDRKAAIEKEIRAIQGDEDSLS